MSTAAGAAARDAGAALALQAEGNRFVLEAAISRAARTNPEFTADHVWKILEADGITELDHPNALGAQFLTASRAGIIEPTDRTTRSSRTTAHRRKVTVWRSLIHRSTK